MSDRIKRLLTFRPRDQAALRDADAHEVAGTLDELLAEHEKRPFVEGDALLSLGRKLRLAGHGSLEARVSAWLGQERSAKRFEIACSFLTGYWRTRGALSEPLVRLVLDRLTLCERDPTLLATALLALSQVPFTGASERLVARTRDALSSYIAKADAFGLEPGLLTIMTEAALR